MGTIDPGQNIHEQDVGNSLQLHSNVYGSFSMNHKTDFAELRT